MIHINQKYFKTIYYAKKIIHEKSGDENSFISSGIMNKKGSDCRIYNFSLPCLSFLYIASGRGKYIDARTKECYPITPGCVLQRLPHVVHHTIIEEESNWLEIYINLNSEIFDTLVKIGLVMTKPVFYVGLSQIIFDKMIRFVNQVKDFPDYDATELVAQAQEILLYLNNASKKQKVSSDMERLCEYLQTHHQVSANLKDICENLYISYEAIRKKFKSAMGLSISDYILNQRISHSKQMLISGKSNKEIANELGYCDEYAFSNQFKKNTGISPKNFVNMFGKIQQ